MTKLQVKPSATVKLLVAVAFAANLSVVAVGWFGQRSENEDACARAQDNREIIRAVITEAYKPSGGLPLTSPPEFAALPPEVQAYLVAIESRSSSPESQDAANDRREAVLATAPPLEC